MLTFAYAKLRLPAETAHRPTTIQICEGTYQIQRVVMSRELLGKDPELEYSSSPTVWDDGHCYVIQGWRITNAGTLAQTGTMPDHETVLRLLKRMMQFFEEVSNGGVAGL